MILGFMKSKKERKPRIFTTLKSIIEKLAFKCMRLSSA